MAEIPPMGCFGVTATGGWGAWWIRLGTFSRYNHAFIVGPDGQIVEAQPGGARLGHISQYPNARYNLHTSLTPDQRQLIWDNALKMLGVGYSWLDIFAQALKFFHISLPWVNRRLARLDKLTCAELVAVDYDRSGAPLFHGKAPQSVNPGDLGDLLVD